MAPGFVGRKWFLSEGGTYRTEGTTRGGPISLLFHDDGTFEITAPGPVDKPSGPTYGRWWLSDPGDPTRVIVEIPGQRTEYRIVEVGEDELRLEELPPR
jgi:hypothetical protein